MSEEVPEERITTIVIDALPTHKCSVIKLGLDVIPSLVFKVSKGWCILSTT